MKENTKKTAEKSIGYLKKKLTPRKPWITNKIMELIKQRNDFKKEDETMYRITKYRVTQKCREAKEKWMDGISQDIQFNLSSCNLLRAYIIKNFQGTRKQKKQSLKTKSSTF